MTFDYSMAAVPIRRDLASSHTDLATHLTTPGTWWDGEARAAIARAARCARSCGLCRELEAAPSPHTITGVHEDDSGIDPAIVDLIHRIVSDPGRLSRAWYERSVERVGLEPERFVELAAVASFSLALDVFARAVGVAPMALPDPTAGTPSRHRPEETESTSAWVPRLAPGASTDWVALFGDRGSIAEVELAWSLVPAEVEMLRALAPAHYMAFENVTRPHHTEPGRAIDRMQMEFVAARVSTHNDCFY